jgi:fluoride exporter
MLLVGAGGFVGSVMRFGLSLLTQRFAISFPHGTLWANLLGCFFIGIVTALAASTEVLSPSMRLLLATGVCGGFTTMSSFIYEIAQFARDSEYAIGALYLMVTLLGCALMFGLGTLATRAVLRVT